MILFILTGFNVVSRALMLRYLLMGRQAVGRPTPWSVQRVW